MKSSRTTAVFLTLPMLMILMACGMLGSSPSNSPTPFAGPVVTVTPNVMASANTAQESPSANASATSTLLPATASPTTALALTSLPTTTQEPTATVEVVATTETGVASSPNTCGDEEILFVSDRKNPGTTSEGTYDIFAMKPDGSGQRELTNNGDAETIPRWSPDYNRIIFVRPVQGPLQLFTIDRNGQDERQLTTEGGDDPVYSPDGTKIAFDSNRSGGDTEIFVMNADGSNPQQLTNNNYDDVRPSWGPDGTILFNARISDKTWEIHSVPSTGGGNQQVIPAREGVQHFAPVYSPDGKRFAYSSNQNGQWDIYIRDLATGKDDRITEDAATDDEPAWSPNSNCLAFTSIRGGNREVYTVELARLDRPMNRTNSAARENYPSWKP